jgi:BirA family biotin operon repressor/biotin-[acetyl-CoA-carboxylase] ligase
MKALVLKNPFEAPVYHEETVTSTFDIARVLAERNEPHGTVITADHQTAGKGRQGRPWVTERGKNLLFTILLKFKEFSSIPKALTLRTGLAVSLAIEDIFVSLSQAATRDVSVTVKWPNDVMINSRKTAGILTEADGGNVFIGVGVNVAQTEFQEEYRSKAGSIARFFPGLPENARFLLLEKILFRLHEEIQKPGETAPWHDRLSRRLYKQGGIVTCAYGAADSTRLVTGTLSGIGPDGELLIIPEGEKNERTFITGELRVY